MIGSCGEAVDGAWSPKLKGRVEADNVGTAELKEVCMDGAFCALSSRTRCCNRSFSIFNSRNVFNLDVDAARERKSHVVERGTYIAAFLLGYIFAVAKKHLQVSSPSTKWGYPMISNNTSVPVGVASGVLVEDADDGTSGFVCIRT